MDPLRIASEKEKVLRLHLSIRFHHFSGDQDGICLCSPYYSIDLYNDLNCYQGRTLSVWLIFIYLFAILRENYFKFIVLSFLTELPRSCELVLQHTLRQQHYRAFVPLTL